MSPEEQMKAARGGTFVSQRAVSFQIGTDFLQGKGIAAYAEVLEGWRENGQLEGMSVTAATS